jgi:hypothetical protein
LHQRSGDHFKSWRTRRLDKSCAIFTALNIKHIFAHTQIFKILLK